MTTSQTVLNKKGNLLGQAEGHRAGESGGLAEVDEVLEGESKGNGFGKSNGNVLVGLIDVGVLTDGDGSTANVTLAGELHTFLGSLNDNWTTSQ